LTHLKSLKWKLICLMYKAQIGKVPYTKVQYISFNKTFYTKL